jgi:hypothetical protein
LVSHKAREIKANKKAKEIEKIYPLVQISDPHAPAVFTGVPALVVPVGQGLQVSSPAHQVFTGHADKQSAISSHAVVSARSAAGVPGLAVFLNLLAAQL